MKIVGAVSVVFSILALHTGDWIMPKMEVPSL